MKVIDLTKGTVSATGAGDTFYPFGSVLQKPITTQGILQVTKTGTISVKLEGRISDDDAWYTIGTYTADTGASVQLMPQMRYNATTMTGATIKMKLAIPIQ